MITLYNHSTQANPVSEEALNNWIPKLLPPELIIEDVGIVLLGDEELLEMNIQHLNHDYYTDILTFDYSENDNLLEAELYISIDRVIENAALNTVTTEQEFLRVVSHGFLHLLGMDDHTPEEKQTMREKEDLWIEQFYDVSRGTEQQ